MHMMHMRCWKTNGVVVVIVIAKRSFV